MNNTLRALREEYLRLDPERIKQERELASQRERDEQIAAQVAAFSAHVMLHSIDRGLKNTIESLKPKPKSKYEYNQERKRDFRVGKAPKSDNKIDLAASHLENTGRAAYLMLETDPSPYIRDYKLEVFEGMMKQIHRKFSNFNEICKIDLSQQRIGDQNCDRLCNAIAGSRIESLNLMGNQLTNFGIECLSKVMRSLGHLKALNLSWNDFTDRAIEHLTHPDRYSGTIQDLDLQNNHLTIDSAFFLAVMFSNNLQTSLTKLRIGGAIGRKAWGDDYLQVLLTSIMNNKVYQLEELYIPDFFLSDTGLQILLSLITCDRMNLKVLNINKNFIKNVSLRNAFITALRISKKRIEFLALDCGFSQKTLVRINRQLSTESREECCKWLDYSQYLNLTTRALYSFNEGKFLYVKLNQVMLNMKRVEKTIPFEKLSLDFENDLLSNISAIMPKSAGFIGKLIRGELVALNNQVAFLHALQEVKVTGMNREISQAHTHRSARNADGQYEDLLIERIDATFRALRRYETLSRSRFHHWEHSIENLLHICKIVVDDVENKLGKRRQRGPKHASPEQLEWIQMALEDAYSHTVEQGFIDQFVIGLQNEQRLLRFCEVQRSLKTGKNKEVIDFEDYMRSTIPSRETLGIMAFYVQYTFVQFPKDKEKLAANFSHLQLPATI